MVAQGFGGQAFCSSGLYRDTGKENRNYYSALGLYRDDGEWKLPCGSEFRSLQLASSKLVTLRFSSSRLLRLWMLFAVHGKNLGDLGSKVQDCEPQVSRGFSVVEPSRIIFLV